MSLSLGAGPLDEIANVLTQVYFNLKPIYLRNKQSPNPSTLRVEGFCFDLDNPFADHGWWQIPTSRFDRVVGPHCCLRAIANPDEKEECPAGNWALFKALYSQYPIIPSQSAKYLRMLYILSCHRYVQATIVRDRAIFIPLPARTWKNCGRAAQPLPRPPHGQIFNWANTAATSLACCCCRNRSRYSSNSELV